MPPARGGRIGVINSRRLRILVLEDHPDVRDLLALFLPRLGHRTEAVGDTTAALERLREDRFDVLLTDRWRPDEHGWCLLRQLRVRGDLPPYVVSTSADVQPDLVLLSRAAGCDAHLEQPFRLSEVEQVMEAICVAVGAVGALRKPAATSTRGVLPDANYRNEARRLQVESRELCAIVARNITLCRQAVEEARKTYAQRQRSRLVMRTPPAVGSRG